MEKSHPGPPSLPQGRGRPIAPPGSRRPWGCGGARGGCGDPSIAGVPPAGSETLRLSPPPSPLLSLPSLLPPSFLPSFSGLVPGREGGSACSPPSRLPTLGSLLPPTPPPRQPPGRPPRPSAR